MAKMIRLPGVRPVNEGERLVIDYLKEHLSSKYTLIPNAEISQWGQPTFEYDLIVVAPHAVYVVEIKDWRGGIRGNDVTWTVNKKHSRPNPWRTANNKSRVLKSQVVHHQPSCRSLWIEAVIAIADEQGKLELRGHCSKRVFCYTDLPAFLKDASALDVKVGNWRSARAYIEKAIQKAARGRKQGPLRFGDYEVQETLSRQDRVAEYLARDTLLRVEKPVRLRVFAYDPYLKADELAQRQEVIRRETESLREIGSHPNLIALQGFTTAPDDPNQFIEVTEWSEEGTLQTLMDADDPLSLERKLELIAGITAGLQAAHDADVIHRDVRPENVLIGQDGQPRLMNFDYARLPLPQAGTVSPIRHDPDVTRAYMAPELLDAAHRPKPATDFYGLGMILFTMLTDEPLYNSPEDARRANTSAGGPMAFGVAGIPPRLNELVCRMIVLDPQRRPQSAAEVLDELDAVRWELAGGVAAKEPAKTQLDAGSESEPEPAVFAVDDLIDSKYKVQKVLEAGGSGRVYQVYDDVFGRVVALKVFNITDISLNFIKQEAQSLLDVSHPNIVRVYSWGRLPQTGRLYLITDFVQGENLIRYTSSDHRLPVQEAIDTIVDLLSALQALHPNVDRLEALRVKEEAGTITDEELEEFERLQSEGWLHRDIKPANLMLSSDGLKLVDFNIAARASEAHLTRVGTPGYMLPDVGTVPWNTDGDLFATGIVLYELITGQHPYSGRFINVQSNPTDPCEYVSELHPKLAELLMRAVSCGPDLRYHSAWRFQQDLLSVHELMSGSSLKDYVHKHPHPDLVLSLSWALNLCEELQEVCARGGAHADVSPQNIRLIETGVAKLIDLDLANSESSAGVRSEQTGVYDLCAVFYEVWTGEPYTHYENDDSTTWQEMLRRLGENYSEIASLLRERLAKVILSGLRPTPISLADLGTVLNAIQEQASKPQRMKVAPGDADMLEAAIAEITDGGTLYLLSGQHRLTRVLTIEKPLRLAGEGQEITTLISDARECVVRFSGPGRIEAQGITFEHQGKEYADVVIVNGDKVDLTHCRFTGGVSDGKEKQGGNGLRLTREARGQIVGCRMDGNALSGICVKDQAQPTLRENTCQNNRCGIAYADDAGGVAQENTCIKNTHGIQLNQQAEPELKKNICRENKASGISYAASARGVARKNECVENGQHGILVSGQAQPTLEQNFCLENKQCGIRYSSDAGGIARLNECARNVHGILVRTRAHPTLEENTCRENKRCGIRVDVDASVDLRLSKNICTDDNGECDVCGWPLPRSGPTRR